MVVAMVLGVLYLFFEQSDLLFGIAEGEDTLCY